MKRCIRCVMPRILPHADIDGKGVCLACRDRGTEETPRAKRARRGEFRRLITRSAGKGDYDILACYSGGRDSTYMLYLLKEVYALRVLAFTFDNGFVAPGTRVNMEKALAGLKVDQVVLRPRPDILGKIFSSALTADVYPLKAAERASAICTSCINLAKYSALKVALEKKIPCIGYGWSPGQSPLSSSILRLTPSMARGMASAARRPLEKLAGRSLKEYFPAEDAYSKAKHFPWYAHPLAFHPYDDHAVNKALRSLGWKRPAGLDANSTNCLLNALAVESHIRRYGFHPYTDEVAALVRGGYMTRAEGMWSLERPVNRKTLREVRERLKRMTRCAA